MADKKVFDLRARRNPVAGQIRITDDERLHDVLKLNGLQYQRLEAIQDTDPATLLYELAHECVPSLTREEVLALDRDLVGAILVLAGQGIAAVEQLFPNAESPEPPTSPG